MTNEWIEKKVDENVIFLLEDQGFNPLIAKLLALKGIESSQEAGDFMNLSLAKLHDPFDLPYISEAIDRIIEAIKKKENIFVWGDYDVDGITSTAVVITTLKLLGAKFIFHVPHRVDDGYDIKPDSIDKMLERGAELIITVDCGIVAFEAAKYAKSKGVDLIITDHHTPHENGKIPDCLAVINPKISDSYPFKDLAGVGIAFKFMCALAFKLGFPIKKLIKHTIEFVALGTVADVAPMTGENRILVHHGCIGLNNTKKIGVKSLLKVSRTQNIDSTNIGFTLGPRINAVGRLYDPLIALRLLITEDEDEALILSQEMEQANLERQKIQQEAIEQATEHLELNHDPKEDRCIVMASPQWPVGVVGLIAGKLSEKHSVPSLIAHVKPDKYAKGSCRSAQNINILECLKSKECYSLFKEKQDGTKILGGHAFAAGFEISIDNVDLLRKELSSYIKRKYPDLSFERKTIYYDHVIKISEINEKTVKEIIRLAPFGSENLFPIFRIKNCSVESVTTVSSGKHLKFSLFSSIKGFADKKFTAMWWNKGQDLDEYVNANKIEILGQLDASENTKWDPTVFITDVMIKESNGDI